MTGQLFPPLVTVRVVLPDWPDSELVARTVCWLAVPGAAVTLTLRPVQS